MLKAAACSNFIFKSLQHRRFFVNIAKVLRTSFLQNTSGGCFCSSKKFLNFPGKHQWRRLNRFILFNKFDWARLHVNILLKLFNILHFCITWAIFQQFSRRDVKLVPFFIIFHLLNYTSPLIPKLHGHMKQSLLWSRINAKKRDFVVHGNISQFVVSLLSIMVTFLVATTHSQLKNRFFEANRLCQRIKYRFAVYILLYIYMLRTKSLQRNGLNQVPILQK